MNTWVDTLGCRQWSKIEIKLLWRMSIRKIASQSSWAIILLRPKQFKLILGFWKGNCLKIILNCLFIMLYGHVDWASEKNINIPTTSWSLKSTTHLPRMRSHVILVVMAGQQTWFPVTYFALLSTTIIWQTSSISNLEHSV